MGCVLYARKRVAQNRSRGRAASVPANTVTAACISANVAIASVHEAIAAGSLGVAIAGGVETLSDVPIRYQRSVRKRLIASQKAKTPVDYMKLLTGLKPQDLLPETPAIAEFSTGQTMGESAERLAKRLGISREAQDAFAAASHQQAHAAHEKGRYAEQIVPVRVAPKFGELTRDNGVRGDTTPEKLAGLSPAFDKRFGSVTAGNSSFLTDGAAASSQGARVKALGLTPLARIVATAWVAIDPVEELLLGPAYAVPAALERAGLTLDDIGVWEIHEAFAVPVLAALQLLADSKFCKEKLGLSRALEVGPR
jgi:acetyl-CoA acyltransferase